MAALFFSPVAVKTKCLRGFPMRFGGGLGVLCLAALVIASGTAWGAGEISEEEIGEFSTQVSKAVEDSDIGAFNNLIDWNDILNEVTRLPESDQLEKARKDFKVEFRKATKSKDSICGAIIATVETGGDYSLIHANTEGERPFALFRLILPGNGGVNFHKYFLKRDSQDQVVAEDMYIYLSAEPLTEIFRRGWAALAQEILKEKEGGGSTEEAEKFLKNIEAVGQFFDAVNQSKDEEAVKLFDSFSDETKQEKTVLIARMRVAQRTSNEEYAKAIEDIRKFHPDDPALNFLFIDGYLLQDKYDEALTCIAKTTEGVGGDAYLTMMKANVLMKMQKTDEALAAVKEAEEEEPDLESVYSIGLDICLAAKDYDMTATYLTKLEKDFGYTWKDLSKVDVFKEFTESPQYKTWLERNK